MFHSAGFTDAPDFGNHAHYIVRFAESFQHGQPIPRTVTSPLLFPDAAIPTANVPTFQYYAFFEGLWALPYRLMGFSGITSAVLGTILIRFVGSLFLYLTCRLLGALPLVSFIGTFSYLISPYTMSCFYGRGSLAEVFAQSLLPLVVYGFALGMKERWRASVITTSIAIFSLSLCHNIFLMYGAVLFAILVLASFNFKAMVSAGVGMVLGLCMSAWQWLPMQATVRDTMFKGISFWTMGASVERRTVSYSGFFGFPQRFHPAGLAEPTGLFLTLGWWTLPFIAMLFLAKKGKRKIAFSLLVSSVVFYLLTFGPLDIYQFMPGFFSIVQDSYRLLSFLSLLGGLAFAIGMPKIEGKLGALILVMMIFSQIPLIDFYARRVKAFRQNDVELEGHPINYYYSEPANVKIFRAADGVLDWDNMIFLESSEGRNTSLRLIGLTLNPTETSSIYVVSVDPNYPEKSLKIVSKKFQIAPGNFDVTLSFVHPKGWYRVVTSRTNESVADVRALDEYRKYSILINAAFLETGRSGSYIYSGELASGRAFGYTRSFKVKSDVIGKHLSDFDGNYTIEL